MAKVNKPRKLEDGTWHYPPSKAVFEEVGLYTIEHYIEKRQNSIADFVATREIFKLCKRSKRNQGSGHLKGFWWEQRVADLDVIGEDEI